MNEVEKPYSNRNEEAYLVPGCDPRLEEFEGVPDRLRMVRVLERIACLTGGYTSGLNKSLADPEGVFEDLVVACHFIASWNMFLTPEENSESAGS